MGIVFGLAAAIGWGTADFLTRFATRKVGAYRTVLLMQFFGLVVLTLYVLLSGELRHYLNTTSWEPWAWATVYALLNTFSVVALFRAYQIGDLSITAPVAASYPIVTVVLSVLSGETLGVRRAVAIAVMLLGIVLASYAPGHEEAQGASSKRRLAEGVNWALVSALGAGVAFWLLGFKVTPQLGTVVPVWVIRLVTPVALVFAAPPLRQKIRMPRGSVWWLIGAIGLLDTGAFLATTQGLQTTQVAVVSVLVSLFSAVTILLAWIFLREALRWSQWLGVVLILAGIIAIHT